MLWQNMGPWWPVAKFFCYAYFNLHLSKWYCWLRTPVGAVGIYFPGSPQAGEIPFRERVEIQVSLIPDLPMTPEKRNYYVWNRKFVFGRGWSECSV